MLLKYTVKGAWYIYHMLFNFFVGRIEWVISLKLPDIPSR